MSQSPFYDEDNDFDEVNANNFQRIQDKITKIGYADGVVDGRESVFQKSFDQGYTDGLRTGLVLEKYRSFFETISGNTAVALPEQLQKEQNVYQQLQLAPTKSKDHFKYLNNRSDTLMNTSENQDKYIESIVRTCTSTMPATTDLLKYN